MKTENMKTVGAALLCTLAICSSPIVAIAQSVNRNGSTTKDTYVFFNESERLEYKDAVAKARENDPKAYYWLAYYFATGDGVSYNADASWRCLSKSASLGYPEANYAKALLISDRIMNRSVRIPKSNSSLFTRCGSLLGSRGLGSHSYYASSDADVAAVEALFNCAIAGGIAVATNDLARFQADVRAKRSAIADARAAAESANALKAEADDVLKALEQEEQAANDTKRKAEDEAKDAARKTEEGERKKIEAEAAYWATWPKQTSFHYNEILLACADELGIVVQYGDTNTTWKAGCGKSLIVASRPTGRDFHWMKYDDTGKLEKSGPPKAFCDEYTWLTNRAAQVTARRITDWAKEHGMTYDEAVQKHNEYLSTRNSSQTRGRASLRGRSIRTQSWAEEKTRIATETEAQRRSEPATEYEQRERRREAERAQLLLIQEDLHRAREERNK